MGYKWNDVEDEERRRPKMASPIDRAISADTSNPDSYMFKCALCPRTVFSGLLRVVKKEQADHTAKTGHDISFIRGKMIKPGRGRY
jgi:hypothetical protein